MPRPVAGLRTVAIGPTVPKALEPPPRFSKKSSPMSLTPTREEPISARPVTWPSPAAPVPLDWNRPNSTLLVPAPSVRALPVLSTTPAGLMAAPVVGSSLYTTLVASATANEPVMPPFASKVGRLKNSTLFPREPTPKSCNVDVVV